MTINLRLQQAIKDKYGTQVEFRRQLAKQGHKVSASAVHSWIWHGVVPLKRKRRCIMEMFDDDFQLFNKRAYGHC